MLTVVSWNILADAYVRPEHFPHTTPDVLEPRSRGAGLLDRLLVHAATADVLCLQEVEPAMFATLRAKLDAFEGHFLQKVDKPDGCAIFARRSRGAPKFRELIYSDKTGHGALAAVIGGVGVATTHLKWEPADVPLDVRLGRAELAELVDAWLVPGETWIICGDLNAEATSPVLEIAFVRGLRDAYVAMPDACTCNSNARRKRIDFLLHTADLDAAPTSLPPITDVTPLPSTEEPSDHLAIRASFTKR